MENIKADILLLASENDDCWTAEVSAKHIAEILENVNYPHRVKNVIYEKGSHAIGSRLGNAATRKRITGMLLASKKMPEIGMATAYRMLGVLEEVGAIRREGIFQMCCHRHMEVQGFEVETDTKNVS